MLHQDEDGDSAPATSRWTRSWFCSALLRLLFVGAAVLAGFLYVQVREGGLANDAEGRGGVLRRVLDEASVEITCAAFAILGAIMVLAMQSELHRHGMSDTSATSTRETRAAGGLTGESARRRLHPGDVFESWMYEKTAALSRIPSAEEQPEAVSVGGASTGVGVGAGAEVGGDRGADLKGCGPVFVRLEGRTLTVWSNTRDTEDRVSRLVPRVALWHEQEASFSAARACLTRRRQYLLQRGVVSLQPEGSEVRRWSRRHPICISAIEKVADEMVSSTSTANLRRTSSAVQSSGTPARLDTDVPDIFVIADSLEGSDGGIESWNSGDLDDVVEERAVRSEDGGVADVADVAEQLLREIVSEELVGMVDEDEASVSDNVPGSYTVSTTSATLLLLARTARQKEEWFRRLQRACGEPHPLDDAVLLEDYAATLQHFLDGGEDDGLDGLNALVGRVLLDVCRSERCAGLVQGYVKNRVASLKVPNLVERPVVTSMYCRSVAVRVRKAYRPVVDALGLWVDLDLSYHGAMGLEVITRLKLTPSQRQQLQGEEELDVDADLNAGGTPASHGYWRIFKTLAQNRFFQAALTALSTTDIVLEVEMRALDGVLCVHLPPPPSDRLWLGFRGVPTLRLVTVPRVGQRTLRHALLCRLIERKLREQLERMVVLPNMVNVVVPFMGSNSKR